MATEQRYLLRTFGTDTNEPGLIREADGTVWVVAPGGTRTQVSGSGDFNSLVLSPADSAEYAAEFDYSANDEWAGAILVRVQDVAALAGSSWVLRAVNEADATTTFQLDAKGGAAIQETTGGGSDSAAWYWRSADADVVLGVMTGQKKLVSAGVLEVSPADSAAVPITTVANDDGAVFDITGRPAAPVTLADVIAALKTLGLVNA